MLPLYTEEEFNKATNKDLLPLKCEHCGKPFYKKKDRIKIVLIGHDSCKARFCSIQCAGLAVKISVEIPCDQCGKLIIKTQNEIRKSKSGKLFCSHLCSINYENNKRKEKGWVRTEESKNQISVKLKQYCKDNPVPLDKRNLSGLLASHPKHDDVELVCIVCKKKFKKPYVKRHYKTCGSSDCKKFARVGCRTYQNGSRKPTWFYNIHQNKKVLLESSWEVKIALWLDKNKIKWVRPHYLKWIDKNNKTRMYFPDFYLPDSNLYLDPKNPYCMAVDKEKLEYFKNKIKLLVGNVDDIIQNLTRQVLSSQDFHLDL